MDKIKGKSLTGHIPIFFISHKDKEKFKFNGDAIRIPSARQLVYNDRRANPQGKIPDDVWEFSRVCGTFKERLGKHPYQMPEALLERIIKVSSNSNDIVLDPFGGTGTTAAVAKKLKIQYITIEVSENYYEVIVKRLNGQIEEIRRKVKPDLQGQNTLFNFNYDHKISANTSQSSKTKT